MKNSKMYNEYVKWCMYLAKCPSLQFIFYLTNEFMVTEYVFFSEVNVTISDIVYKPLYWRLCTAETRIERLLETGYDCKVVLFF